ncbi:MAG: alpha/beta hydrolase [Polyangiales bacterium]
MRSLSRCGSATCRYWPGRAEAPRRDGERIADRVGGDLQAEFFEGISYGDDPANQLDLYVPQASSPTPLLIYIHGGGFTGGSRDTVPLADAVRALLAEQVAVASIDYRLLVSPDPEGRHPSLSDSTQALRFLRYRRQFNIDRNRVVLMGSSAGAGTSLWIAFNDEMADSEASDPVAQFSTRVDGVIALSTQATYDIGKWETVVFRDFPGANVLERPMCLESPSCFSIFTECQVLKEFGSESILEYRARVDMLGLMDGDDPPNFCRQSFAR